MTRKGATMAATMKTTAKIMIMRRFPLPETASLVTSVPVLFALEAFGGF